MAVCRASTKKYVRNDYCKHLKTAKTVSVENVRSTKRLFTEPFGQATPTIGHCACERRDGLQNSLASWYCCQSVIGLGSVSLYLCGLSFEIIVVYTSGIKFLDWKKSVLSHRPPGLAATYTVVLWVECYLLHCPMWTNAVSLYVCGCYCILRIVSLRRK